MLRFCVAFLSSWNVALRPSPPPWDSRAVWLIYFAALRTVCLFLHLVALAGVKPPRKSATRDWITYTARETEAAYYLGGGGACSTSVRATVLFSIELII